MLVLGPRCSMPLERRCSHASIQSHHPISPALAHSSCMCEYGLVSASHSLLPVDQASGHFESSSRATPSPNSTELKKLFHHRHNALAPAHMGFDWGRPPSTG